MTSGTDVLGARPGDHVVLFYQDDDGLAGRVSEYLLEAIQEGGAAIVIATPARRLLFERRLTQAGIDLVAAQVSGSYLALGASETMRRSSSLTGPIRPASGRPSAR